MNQKQGQLCLLLLFGCCCYLVMTNSHSFQQPKKKIKIKIERDKQITEQKKHLKNSFETCDEEKGVCDGWEKNTVHTSMLLVPLVFHANHHHCVKIDVFIYLIIT